MDIILIGSLLLSSSTSPNLKSNLKLHLRGESRWRSSSICVGLSVTLFWQIAAVKLMPMEVWYLFSRPFCERLRASHFYHMKSLNHCIFSVPREIMKSYNRTRSRLIWSSTFHFFKVTHDGTCEWLCYCGSCIASPRSKPLLSTLALGKTLPAFVSLIPPQLSPSPNETAIPWGLANFVTLLGIAHVYMCYISLSIWGHVREKKHPLEQNKNIPFKIRLSTTGFWNIQQARLSFTSFRFVSYAAQSVKWSELWFCGGYNCHKLLNTISRKGLY